jgi:hypothetical protein
MIKKKLKERNVPDIKNIIENKLDTYFKNTLRSAINKKDLTFNILILFIIVIIEIFLLLLNKF